MRRGLDSIIFSVFGDFRDLNTENSEKFRALKQKMAYTDLMVTIDKQVRMEVRMEPGKPPQPIRTVVKKPKLMNEDESLLANFYDDRVDFIVKDLRNRVLDFRILGEELLKILNLVIDVYSLQSNKLALNVDYIISEYKESDAKTIYGLFLNPKMKIYKDKDIRDWQVIINQNIQIEGSKTPANVNMTVVRGLLTNGKQNPEDLVLVHVNLTSLPIQNLKIAKAGINKIFNFYMRQYHELISDLEVNIDENLEAVQ